MGNWEKVSAVQRMQDFIEEHLNAPITLYMLSNAAGYSPWHSAILFQEYASFKAIYARSYP